MHPAPEPRSGVLDPASGSGELDPASEACLRQTRPAVLNVLVAVGLIEELAGFDRPILPPGAGPP
jgi:hypothetical protein